eukprot:1134409-Pelagomonas_calceolata.AAC.3
MILHNCLQTGSDTLLNVAPGGQGRPSRQLRPVTAVHSYHDISPVVSADHVADTDLDRSRVKTAPYWSQDDQGPGGSCYELLETLRRTFQESTLQRPFSAAPDLRASGHSSFGRGPKGMSLPNTSFLDTDRTPMHLRNPDARRVDLLMSSIHGWCHDCRVRYACSSVPFCFILLQIKLNQRFLGKTVWVRVQSTDQGTMPLCWLKPPSLPNLKAAVASLIHCACYAPVVQLFPSATLEQQWQS